MHATVAGNAVPDGAHRVAILLLYGAATVATYRVLLQLWRARPDPTTTLLAGLIGVHVFGYVSYLLGTAQILRAVDAEPIPRARAPELYRLVEGLAGDVGIDPPQILVAYMDAPNALALGGPRDGEVILDARLFRVLSAQELRGILAHELAHLERRDGLIQTLGYALVQTVAGLLFLALLPLIMLASGAARGVGYLRGKSPADIRRASTVARTAVTALAVVLLFVFTIVLRAYARRRELADDRAVELTGDPGALASALATIQRAATPSGPLSSLYIHGDEEGTLTRLLAIHPPMQDRVERLRDRANGRNADSHIPIR